MNISVIKSRYLDTAKGFISDDKVFEKYAMAANLPISSIYDPNSIIPSLRIRNIYEDIVKKEGFTEFFQYFNKVNKPWQATTILETKFSIPPMTNLQALSSLNPNSRETNSVSIRFHPSKNGGWLLLSTTKYSGDTYILDLVFIHYMRILVSYLVPNFFPKKIRIRAKGSLDRARQLEKLGFPDCLFEKAANGIWLDNTTLVLQPHFLLEAIEPINYLQQGIPQSYSGLVFALLQSYQNDIRLDLENLSDIVNIPMRTIQRGLQKEGTNFHSLRIKCKLARASELLRNTDLTITEISFMLNFDSPGNFSRFFSKFSKFSPSAFRKNNLINPVGDQN